jgi:hypothetical protein
MVRSFLSTSAFGSNSYLARLLWLLSGRPILRPLYSIFDIHCNILSPSRLHPRHLCFLDFENVSYDMNNTSVNTWLAHLHH